VNGDTLASDTEDGALVDVAPAARLHFPQQVIVLRFLLQLAAIFDALSDADATIELASGAILLLEGDGDELAAAVADKIADVDHDDFL